QHLPHIGRAEARRQELEDACRHADVEAVVVPRQLAEIEPVPEPGGRDAEVRQQVGEEAGPTALEDIAVGQQLLDELRDSLARGVLAGPPAQGIAHAVIPSWVPRAPSRIRTTHTPDPMSNPETRPGCAWKRSTRRRRTRPPAKRWARDLRVQQRGDLSAPLLGGGRPGELVVPA